MRRSEEIHRAKATMLVVVVPAEIQVQEQVVVVGEDRIAGRPMGP